MYNYEEWFGILYFVLFDLYDCIMKICFGLLFLNDWYLLKVGGSMLFFEVNVNFKNKIYIDFWKEDKNELIFKR